MKIYNNLADTTEPFADSFVPIGNFDGVHLGHRAVEAQLPIEIKPVPENISYLKCKKDKMGHPPRPPEEILSRTVRTYEAQIMIISK